MRFQITHRSKSRAMSGCGRYSTNCSWSVTRGHRGFLYITPVSCCVVKILHVYPVNFRRRRCSLSVRP